MKLLRTAVQQALHEQRMKPTVLIIIAIVGGTIASVQRAETNADARHAYDASLSAVRTAVPGAAAMNASRLENA